MASYDPYIPLTASTGGDVSRLCRYVGRVRFVLKYVAITSRLSGERAKVRLGLGAVDLQLADLLLEAAQSRHHS